MVSFHLKQNESGVFSLPPAVTPQEKARAARLASLRAAVQRLERRDEPAASSLLPLGLPPLDRHLPGGGLPLGALHEIEGARGEWDDGPATAFCLMIVKRILEGRSGAVLWISGRHDLYGPGLAALGLDPGRFLFARAWREEERLWAMEEGLAEPTLACVVGEVEAPSARAGRRLQLAAARHGVTAFMLRRGLASCRDGREASSARTRWRISAESSNGLANDIASQDPGPKDPGKHAPSSAALWQIDLLRCRGSTPKSWLINAETGEGRKAYGECQHGPRTADPLALAPTLCERTFQAVG